MTQAKRDRAEALRRREHELQAEELSRYFHELKFLQEEARRQQMHEDTPAPIAEPSIGLLPKLATLDYEIPDSRVFFDQGDYPCYVMSATNLCTLDELPLHEEA